ncbi:amidohydrolase [Sphingopyxis sp. Root214]|uniref:carbon-nitrogen hydrolase family protein n=1 Tax=unclassified Sphingopyxis TaxID=2614943 RepID=UPI0006F65704|nr:MULTISPECIES: carbon-nitrogen hydrolase family protein [unclassified Sphingopyxis]KQZ76698.1 amidohydrolase [Sphingopyxis sp. Root154]KRC09415.1 amidohydrolase [Sphingopyxis sp. Root214]
MTVDHPRFRAAAVQAAPVFLDLDASLAKAVRLIEEAAANGAALVAFPETFLPGYPWYIWLDSPAWGMQFVQRYFDNSLAYGSPEADRLQRAAEENGVMVAMGLSERDGGSLYIGQWLIGADGNTVSRRRKLKPTHVERTVFGEGDGRDLSVFDTPLGRVGALCCWEHLQPLSKYAMYAQNEQVHVAAWPSFSIYPEAHQLSVDVNSAASRLYAVEGGCYVIASTALVSAEMIAMLCNDDMKRSLLKEGGGYSQIYAPDGRLISEGLPENQEGLVYADLDLGLISLAKAATDPAGHYSRPDVTRLLLDKTPGDRMITRRGPSVVSPQEFADEIASSARKAEPPTPPGEGA